MHQHFWLARPNANQGKNPEKTLSFLKKTLGKPINTMNTAQSHHINNYTIITAMQGQDEYLVNSSSKAETMYTEDEQEIDDVDLPDDDASVIDEDQSTAVQLHVPSKTVQNSAGI